MNHFKVMRIETLYQLIIHINGSIFLYINGNFHEYGFLNISICVNTLSNKSGKTNTIDQHNFKKKLHRVSQRSIRSFIQKK